MKSNEEILIAKQQEASKYNTTVESLEENGFIYVSESYGECHWFAFVNGTLMSLAWFRKQQEMNRKAIHHCNRK